MCSVCYQDVALTGEKFALLDNCSHHMCQKCIEKLQQQSTTYSSKCATCRTPFTYYAISTLLPINEEDRKDLLKK